MSLINRMLRDLSSRERRTGDVLSGIEVPRTRATRRGPNWARLGLLVGLVAVFTAALWMLLPKGPPAPPGAPTVTPQSASPAPPPAAGAPAGPAAPAGKLQFDSTLSQVPPAPARPRASRRSADASPAAGAPAAPAAPAERAAPAPAPPRDARAAAQRYAEAREAMARDDDAAAEAALVDALALDPKLHAAREDLGTLRIRQGRLEEAERSVRRGLEEAPQWIGYRRLAARLELARNNGAAAVALLEREPPTVADDPEYHGLLASAYQRVGRHDAAARTYQGLSQQQPGVAQWWAGYGLSRDALGDASGALAAYARARTLGGLDARVLEHINRRSAALAAGE